MMENLMSCCGVLCSECKAYPADCKGCGQERGAAYWLQYVDAAVCPIYDCCVEEKHLRHCGECWHLPCEHWAKYSDPTVPEEEQIRVEREQIRLLKSLV